MTGGAALIIVAFIAGTFDIVVTLIARRSSRQALSGTIANRDILEKVRDNSAHIRRIVDEGHSTLLAVSKFEEYQHARNHDVMNNLTALNMKLDNLLRQNNGQQSQMIALLERIADK